MRREYTTQIIVRCTPEERARWKDLAQRLEAQRREREGIRHWYQQGEGITLSALVRQLLEARLKTAPAARGRRAPAAS